MGGMLYEPEGRIEHATHDQTHLVRGWDRAKTWPTCKYDGLCVYIQRDIKLRKICLYGNMYQRLIITMTYI